MKKVYWVKYIKIYWYSVADTNGAKAKNSFS